MISTIILEPRSFPQGEAGRILAVRSLGWLVSATVAGVVGDVVLAVSAELALAGAADAVGCRLVEAHGDGDRLRGAAAIVRSDAVLVMLAGHAPEAALIEVLARGAAATARVLAEPATLLQRLAPARAPAVGLLAPAGAVRAARDFAALARACRSAPILPARARPLG